MKASLIILFVFLFTGTGYAQTVSGPSLHCATTQANGQVELDWTNNSCPCAPHGLPSDSIYVSSMGINGPYKLLVVLPAGSTSYLQVNANGNDTTYYYYMVANCGCVGSTSLHSDTISNRNPQTPGINFVTVNTNDTTTISWQEGPSPQTYGYVIYEFKNGLYIPIDTVYGRTDTTFKIGKSNADSGSVSYTISALDSCGNIGPYNTSPQNTIYLTDSLNVCAHSITLNWDSYQNWPGVMSYNVYDSINGRPDSLIGTFSSTTFNTAFAGLKDGDDICVWVVANEQGGGGYKSSSNLQCAVVHVVRPVTYCYINRITTASNTEVDLTFSLNNNASLSSLVLQRGLDNVHFYAIQYLSPSASPIFCKDQNIDAAHTSFYYRIIAVDSCNDSTYSSSANNIVLAGYAFSNLNNYLDWNAFNFEYGKVLDYSLYQTYNQLPYSVIYSADSLNYKENVSHLGSTNQQFCYYIIATDSVTYPDGMPDTTTSQSNIICLDQELTILVPNAIVPGGKNIFIPLFAYQDINAYSMQIYNRWGGLIFETNDYTQGWNGTYNGQFVEQGVYAYTITVTDSQDHTVQSAGTVMVIR